MRTVWLIGGAVLIVATGCAKGPPPEPRKPVGPGASKIRDAVRKDAFAIMGQLAPEAGKRGGRIPAFDTASPPAWWKGNATLTKGVRYYLFPNIEGSKLADLNPTRPLFLASGTPILHGFGQEVIAISGGLLPDPSRHISPSLDKR